MALRWGEPATSNPVVVSLYRFAPNRTPKLKVCWWTLVPFVLTICFTVFACITRSRDLWSVLALICFAGYVVLREPRRVGDGARALTVSERSGCERS